MDQLANAAAVASGKSGRIKAAFPFGDDFTQANSRRNGNSRDVPSAVFDVMMAFKPYERGNYALWALNKLAGFNKHQAVIPLVASLGTLTFHSWGSKWRVPERWKWDSRRNEVILAISEIGSDFHLGYHVSKHIVIDKIPGVSGHEAIRFFDHLVDMTEEIISAVESESRRIGIL